MAATKKPLSTAQRTAIVVAFIGAAATIAVAITQEWFSSKTTDKPVHHSPQIIAPVSDNAKQTNTVIEKQENKNDGDVINEGGKTINNYPTQLIEKKVKDTQPAPVQITAKNVNTAPGGSAGDNITVVVDEKVWTEPMLAGFYSIFLKVRDSISITTDTVLFNDYPATNFKLMSQLKSFLVSKGYKPVYGSSTIGQTPQGVRVWYSTTPRGKYVKVMVGYTN